MRRQLRDDHQGRCVTITKGGIDLSGIAVAREHQTLGVRTWSNIKSWQYRPSRSHVYGSVGGSNRCCLTMASKHFHRQFHGNRHQTNTHNSKHYRSHDRAPLRCGRACMQACKHASTLAWERASEGACGSERTSVSGADAKSADLRRTN